MHKSTQAGGREVSQSGVDLAGQFLAAGLLQNALDDGEPITL